MRKCEPQSGQNPAAPDAIKPGKTTAARRAKTLQPIRDKTPTALPESFVRGGTSAAFLQFKSESYDCLKRFHDCFPVILLLGLRELVVGNEIGMLFLVVVPGRATTPALLDALPGPVIMIVLG